VARHPVRPEQRVDLAVLDAGQVPEVGDLGRDRVHLREQAAVHELAGLGVPRGRLVDRLV
jgi:hypothetical protein